VISFRFHLASLVAVFLALAIGMLVGSTLLDRVIVDRLNERVDRVSRNLDARAEENRELQGRLDELEGYTEESAAFAVTGRLPDDQVIVAAERGVDEDIVVDTLRLVQQAGATSPGILWLEPPWRLDEDEDLDRLASVLGTDVAEARAMRAEAFEALVGQLQGPPDDGTGTTVPDPLTALVEEGFLAYQHVGEGDSEHDALVGLGDDLVLVSGTQSELGGEPLIDFARRLVDTGVPTLAAEAFRPAQDGPERGSLAERLADVEELAETVATVDDLELTPGRVAAVLGLAALEQGVVGHYGFGPRADRVVPEWSEL
jgi:hypothetical protein